ncbi:MAG: nitroreductase family protein [Chloroflexi bacterium]|nr:nitroreductase family protein [Chloroflexota bacterium]
MLWLGTVEAGVVQQGRAHPEEVRLRVDVSARHVCSPSTKCEAGVGTGGGARLRPRAAGKTVYALQTESIGPANSAASLVIGFATQYNESRREGAMKGGRMPDIDDAAYLKEAGRKIITTRKSVRKYSPEPVADEAITTMLEAARWAPSGENSQCWRFVVVRDPETKKRLGELARAGSGRRFTAEYIAEKTATRFATLKDEAEKERIFKQLTSGAVSAFLGQAPVIIVVCGKMDVWDLPFDASAATENAVLMANAMGLGTCWVVAPVEDVRDEELVRQLLGVPTGFKVMFTVAVGYPNRIPGPRPRKPLDELVFYERFGNVVEETVPPGIRIEPQDDRAVPSDYLNGLVFELLKQFWNERGGGTRFRACTLGWDSFEPFREELTAGKEVESSAQIVRDFLTRRNVLADFKCQLQESTEMEGSELFSRVQLVELAMKGCGHLGIEKKLVDVGIAPYTCLCANTFSYAIKKSQGIWTELSSIKIDGDECRVTLVLLLPK